jgi:small subunit ribosomal protein S27Ae
MAEEKGAAKPAKEKKAEKKGKRVRTGRKHENVKVYKLYKVEGRRAVRQRKFCPRCGDGTFFASHKNREYCGRCGYTIFKKP